MSGSKQDTETVHAFFQDMRACRLGDPIIGPGVVPRLQSVKLRNAARARADGALPSPSNPPRALKAGFRLHPAMPATKAATPAKRTLWLREITHDAFHLVSRRVGQ